MKQFEISTDATNGGALQNKTHCGHAKTHTVATQKHRRTQILCTAAHAKPPRTHARTAAASSQPRAALRTTLGDFATASEPQDRRIETAIVRHRRDTGP